MQEQKNKKLKHSKKIEILSDEETSDEQLNNNDLEKLKKELEELEIQNKNI